ncbi:hypothetical protein R2362_03070 [Mycobacteroides chelonae]|nr:hypothetical protein [Mycobacteroides chelonae]
MAAARRAKAPAATKFDEILASSAGPEPITLDGGNIVAYAPTLRELETLGNKDSISSDAEARKIMFKEDADKAAEYFRNLEPHKWVAFLKMYFEHWLNYEELGK